MSEERKRLFARLTERMRYPQLFVVLLVLFGVDLAIPDAIPFIDEVILAVLTGLVGALRRRGEDRLPAGAETPQLPPPKDD